MKKCFFCGGTPTLGKDKYNASFDNGVFYILCQKCGFKLSGFATKSSARKEWNGLEQTADPREKIQPELV